MDDWDWELLQETQTKETEVKAEEEHQKTASSTASSVCDDCGVIRSDYFSLDSQHKFQEQNEEDESSDNPSWVDPTNITVIPRRERISCSNSDSSDPSDSRNLLDPHSDCCGGEEGEGGEYNQYTVNTPSSCSELDNTFVASTNSVVAVEEEIDADLNSPANGGDEGGGSWVSPESSEAKRLVWWKVPLEVVKYCMMKVGPVWSLSMAAAAVMGLVILRRRYLYRIKRKTQGLQLKLTVDDKKVSQFMSRAARLNEAFSVVKRVPIIRPALPAPGLATWPMVSLR